MSQRPGTSRDTELELHERLDSLATRLAGTVPVAALLDHTLDAVMLATGADFGNLQLVNPGHRCPGDRGPAWVRWRVPRLLRHGASRGLRLRRGLPSSPTRHRDRRRHRSQLQRGRPCGHASRPRSRRSVHAPRGAGRLRDRGRVGHHAEATEIPASALELVGRFAGRAAALIELRNAASLDDMIRLKMSAGLLPSALPTKIWAGFGGGEPCSACDVPVSRGQTEYEFDHERRPYRFHLACFALWEAERHRRGS